MADHLTPKAESAVRVLPLGQAGFRFEAGGYVVYIDPYLSNSVAEIEGEHLQRMVPVVQSPAAITDADWVLISHIHLDHCDPQTLQPLSLASPQCRFVGPNEVVAFSRDNLGIASERLQVICREWIELAPALRLLAVPAAHKCIETDHEGHLRFAGFLLEWQGRRIYHSGDCSVDPTVIEALREQLPIDVGFLPVNECNYYKDQAGIVGNMSIREAFGLATELGMRAVVPMHYDMFASNCVYEEEIEVVYEKSAPPFELIIKPSSV